mmetsp:Transcript_5918/g.8115  ORF Transcript_5918/g.8115 Transcript_5918/m.8115 type:complete len:214 (-) Transcript_5918:263-904(-)
MDHVLIQNQMQELATAFSKITPSDPIPEISPELEKVMIELARTGIPYYNWSLLQELFAVKLVKVVNSYNSEFSYNAGPEAFDFDKRKSLMLLALRSFYEAPFTIQRLAEILMDPKRQYRATHKLMNGIEKLLAVSTTIPQEPLPLHQGAGEESQETHAASSQPEAMEIDSTAQNGEPSPPGTGGESPHQNHDPRPSIFAEHTATSNGASSMEG